jgi:acyl carrier protein
MRKVTIDDLIELFGEVIDVSSIKIDTNAVLGEDIPLNSMEMLRVLSRIESRYKFRFQPREILSLKTLGDVLEVVRRRAKTV